MPPSLDAPHCQSATSSNRVTGTPKEKRALWIIGARAVAICAVVMVHVSDCIVWNTDWLSVKPSWWWMGTFFNAFAMGGVGVFTMISGALLLDPGRNKSIRRFYQRRFLRIVPPYIFWAVLYFGWRKHMEQESLAWSQFPSAVVGGNAYYHLWFMLMIVELYLLTPLLRWVVVHIQRKILIGCLFLWFVAEAVIPSFQHAFGYDIWTEHVPNYIAYLGYVGYFVCGHILSSIRLNRQGMLLAGCAWITGVTWAGAMIFLEARKEGGTLTVEWGNHNFYPQVILVALSAFLILRNLPWESLWTWKTGASVVTAISSASFTIYLLHPLLLELNWYSFSPVSLHATWVHPLVGTPLTALLAVTTCVLFALLARKLFFGWLRPIALVIAPWNAASLLPLPDIPQTDKVRIPDAESASSVAGVGL